MVLSDAGMFLSTGRMSALWCTFVMNPGILLGSDAPTNISFFQQSYKHISINGVRFGFSKGYKKRTVERFGLIQGEQLIRILLVMLVNTPLL